MEFDETKFLYFGTIHDPRLYDKITSVLVKLGIPEKMIVKQPACKFAQIGDYIVNPWFPDEPTELIIGKIKKSETFDPQRRGDGQTDLVSYDKIAIIPFP